MQQEAERSRARVFFTKIEFEVVQFGKSLEWEQVKVADVLAGFQVREQIAPPVVPCSCRQLSIATRNHLERRIGRVRGKELIGVDIDVNRVVDGQQPHTVEIDDFFHRLHQTKTQLSVTELDRVAIHFDVLGRARNVALARCNPVAKNSRT